MNGLLITARFWIVVALFALLPTVDGADSELLSPGLVVNPGFCVNGVEHTTVWPGSRRPEGLSTWGSICQTGDDQGRLETQEFVAPSALNLYLAGYPGFPGLRLFLRNVQSGEQTELRPPALPRQTWQQNNFPVPQAWIGKPVQLSAEDSAGGPLGWLGFSLPILPASSLFPPIDTNLTEDGFCANGVFQTTKWPGDVAPPGIRTWGSYCKSGDADSGWKASQPVMAGSHMSLYVAGYPSTPGILLAVENMQSRGQFLLQIHTSPGAAWSLYHFRLPDAWKGQSVRILASDHTREGNGWIGFSDPVPTDLRAEAASAATTLGLVVIFALILLIPSVAAGVLAALNGIEDGLDLTAVAFLALGLTGYGAFWAYFCNHFLGVAFSCVSLLASCAVIGYGSITPTRRAKLQPLKQLIAPGALVVLASIFILSLGFLHGGEAAPITLAGERFGPPGLITDNLIPKWFADGVFAGHIPRPLFGDWLSSDRPPLQTGNALWTYAWVTGDRNLPYLALSVILQCSFLAALWSFLTACKIDCRPLALVLATCMFSGFTLLNELFTWPKLYPVGFLLIMAAYLITGRYSQVRDRMAIGATLGAAAAFSMLCHGGSIFALAGMAVFMLVTRRWPSGRFLLGMAITVLLLYSPWMLYQKLYEPPGNRLLLWHLAGIIEPHPEGGFTRLLVNRYSKMQPEQLMQYKASNFKVLAGNLAEEFEEIRVFGATLAAGPADTRDDVAGSIRNNMFFHWFPAIGFSVLGPLALLPLGLYRRRSHEVEFVAAVRMWGLTGLTLVIWCLAMFSWEDTIPHHGVYLTEILAFTGSCLAFWAIRPWIAVAATTLQVLWNAALFIWLTPVEIRGVGSTLAGPVNPVLGVVCLLSAAAIFALLAGFARQPAATAAGARQISDQLQHH